jgi:hypothetical protein
MCASYTVLVWSRVLPESAVTKEFLGSSTFMRSPNTRYGLMGVSVDSIHGRNLAWKVALAPLISSSSAGFLRGPPRADSSFTSAASVSLASPITACRVS